MIKGLAITPPVIGRICIGKLVQKENKWLPEKDDSFTLTTQIQQKSGWLLHPLHQHYASSHESSKIRALPVRLLFNDSELNLRAEYSAFDRQSGRLVCMGNGESARRSHPNAIEETECRGPDRCEFAQQHGCKLYGRLNVFVEGQGDELGSFIFRTTGYNSVRTLAARLRYFESVSGGQTRYLPLTLRLRAKSTTQSYRTPVYYVDLTLRDDITLLDAVRQAHVMAQQDKEAGLAITELESAARELLRNGQFEEADDDIPPLLDEFNPLTEEPASVTPLTPSTSPQTPANAPTRVVRRTCRLTPKLGPSGSESASA